MPLIVKESEQHFEPAPPGLHRAVCVDAVDLGLITDVYGTKHKVQLIWQIAAKNKLGERFQVRQRYTASLMEGSNLRRDLESWRGRPFTMAELAEFDLEKLIGVNCQLSVTQGLSKKGRTFAKATAVVPAVKGQPKLEAEAYTRQPWAGESGSVTSDESEPEAEQNQDEDDTPF